MRLLSSASTLHSQHLEPPGTFLWAQQGQKEGSEWVPRVGGSLQLFKYFVGVQSKGYGSQPA